jgi:hypothetical protein
MEKNIMKNLIILISTILLSINCQVSVLGPPEVVSKLKNYQIGTSGSKLKT